MILSLVTFFNLGFYENRKWVGIYNFHFNTSLFNSDHFSVIFWIPKTRPWTFIFPVWFLCYWPDLYSCNSVFNSSMEGFVFLSLRFYWAQKSLNIHLQGHCLFIGLGRLSSAVSFLCLGSSNLWNTFLYQDHEFLKEPKVVKGQRKSGWSIFLEPKNGHIKREAPGKS